ncbi:MAG TPA: recombination protein RecR [Verrucomicrobiales bacterium]|nr:recombination protein RecR [Verrucomicrobiales bacterium]HIL70748.1 recombination protein RecR [Verrucomicrobiota bacterium]
MRQLPQLLVHLTQSLSKLPGIGPKSAERIALYLVQTDPVQVHQIAQTIKDACDKISDCSICGALTEDQPCGICKNPQRDHRLICLVEKPSDLINLEKSGIFKGRYHVLGGKISPINGIGPEDLRIEQLEQRIKTETPEEIIIALDTDVEGDATSYYLAERLSSSSVKVTRLAHGIPAGSGLEYADELTLNHALSGRREIQ